MGGDWKFGWGPQNDEDSLSAIFRAVELGVNWIDTAPAYGLGHAESVVGRAIGDLGNDRPLVFTKCGLVWNESGKITKSLLPSSIRKECESSLRRLGIDAIDLMQIHWPTGSDEDLRAAWEELARMQDEGKVRYLGACNMNTDELALISLVRRPDSVQCEYSFLESESAAQAIAFAGEHDIGFLAYSPLGSGVLAGRFGAGIPTQLPETDWRRNNSRFQGDNLALRISAAEKLQHIGAALGASLIETALAWVLANEVVTGAIVGIRSQSQATQSLGNSDRIVMLANRLKFEQPTVAH